MSRIFLIILMCAFSSVLFSQSALEVIESGQDLNVLYRNEQTFHGFIGTRGWGFGYRRGKHVTGKIKALFEVEGAYMKHPKEIKRRGPAESKGNFVYGKLNTAMLLRAGIGTQHTLFKRTDRKAVEIRSTYFIEANLTFAKPYYVQIFGEGSFRNTEIVKYNPDKISLDSIAGRGPFIYGFDEIKLYPAITAKYLMSIEYGNASYKIKAIEVGIVADYYFKALPIMAKNPAENYIITLQLAFIFGKKWF
ncbi:MAG: hypothetical protein N2203_03430 [Bacteroidia bacterium]|nr:hypothetical protein [Bacteroidia bacterium]